jgi:uncharacterized protein GlcG (DUF336 family)
MGRFLIGLTAAAALIAPATGGAQVLTQRNISLPLAKAIADSALANCERGGFQVSVTVVDRANQIRVLLRDDDAKPHTMDASQRKAYTALTFRRPSSEMEKMAGGQDAALAAIPGTFMRSGGLPIRAGGEVIGAVGVAGAPGGTADEVCAKSALDSVADQLK